MRCGKCGNENAEGNRFCGMCGAALVGKPALAGASSGQARTSAPVGNVAGTSRPVAAAVPVRSVAKETAHLRQAIPPRLSVPAEPHPVPYSAVDDRPVITGPSFLGLNQPASRPQTGDRHGGHDALHSSSGDLDYLLEDEEEPKRGWGKIILVVVALALAVGFGYLHWTQGGFDWLSGGEKKPGAQTSKDGGQGVADSGSATTNPGTASDGAAPQAGASGTGTAAAAANPADSSAPQAAPSQNTSQDAPAQDTSSARSSSLAPTASQSTAPQTKASDSGAPADAESQAQDSDSDEQPSATQPTAERKAALRKAPAKAPAAKPTAATPLDSVAEAERYIYGRGVRQDCDHGLRLLKPAAQNPAAMISLGTLYSTGTCTPRDLPTAYRWFALALHKQPDNQPLQDDLQKLWSQMTQPERQLAIKLSQ